MKRHCRPEIAGPAAEGPADGVPLNAAPLFAPTRSEGVFAMLAYAGTAKSIEEMHAGIVAEARQRHSGDRS
jgi:hypothetical protein